MDQQLVGWARGIAFAFLVERVAPVASLEMRVRYRPARPEEKPSTRVGYQVCDLGSATSPPRFASVVRMGTGKDWNTASPGDCRFGVCPDPAYHSRLTVDAVDLTVSTGGAFSLARGLDPGPIGRISPGGSLVQALSRPNAKAELAMALQTLTRSPLRAVGPVEVTTGIVKRGDTVASVAARHALTGRLRNEVRAKGLLARGAAPLPVGQPVYGVTTPYGGQYWCAPRDAEGKWTAVCLPTAGGAARWMAGEPALFPQMMLLVSNSSLADAPSVAPEPLEFGPPLQVEYRFAGGNRKWTQVDVIVRSANGKARASFLTLTRGPDGSAELRLMGGRLKLTPDPDMKRATVSLTEPPTAQGALPF
jgi:hypothetical protein